MKPLRMCMVCRARREKEDLIRIVKNGEGIAIDLSGKMQGRGAYICKNGDCYALALKRKALERAFSCKVNEEIYDELQKVARNINEQ